MSFTVGRASLPVDPSSATWNGDTLTIEGWISPTVANDTNQAYAIRQQLLGLVDNVDESVFPCTFSGDPNWDGFYSVESVRVDGRPGLMETQGRMPYTLTLRRVGGYALPLAEATLSSVIRTNAHGVVAANSHLVVPPTTDNPGSFYASGSNTDMSSEDGTLFRNTRTGPVTNTFLPYGVLPADWYKGSARVSVSYGGTYYPIVGQQIPRLTAVRIQNANFRMDVSSSAVITLSMYHDAAWESSPSFVLRQSGNFDSLTNVRVLRNSPEQVTVRLSLEASAATTSPCEMDVTLHRGHQTACCLFTPYGGGTSATLSIRASAVTACTAVTGGIEQTTADVSGNKWFILNTVASTNDLVNGYRTTNAAVAVNAPFAIGMFASTGVVAGDLSTTEVRDCFWGEYSETHRVVER